MNSLTKESRIKIRAAVNNWIMSAFPAHRQYLCHEQPQFDAENRLWVVNLGAKNINGHSQELGKVFVDDHIQIILGDGVHTIVQRIDSLLEHHDVAVKYPSRIRGKGYEFRCGDGVQAAKRFKVGKIDLLLTDPPYGISKTYTCEKQVPRRLRTNGRDFIMPKGDFGQWDKPLEPQEWLDVVLPKVSGWVVSFCAQAQISEYQVCLEKHKFVAIGTLVWQKTNPVPFNHRYKPVNAWEAVVVGKRPNTRFNGGGVVHNVFKHKSPSPQVRIHPTQKPLELIGQFIELFSKRGDFVYDPFAGSSTTLIAASRLSRRALGYEMNDDIYQAACKRIKRELNGKLRV